MAYASIFVASLLAYSAPGFANPATDTCLDALFADEPEATQHLAKRLEGAQFQRVGRSAVFQHPGQGRPFLARVMPCAQKGAEVEFFVDFMPSLKANPLEQIRAIVPNGAAGGTSLASQKPHLLFIFAPDERGRKRHLVLSADGSTSYETPYLPFTRLTALRISFQEHCRPVERLISIGFRPVPDTPGFYQYDLRVSKAGEKVERWVPILAEIQDDKLMRLMRPLKFSAESVRMTLLNLGRIEVSHGWAHVELNGHVFTRELRFNASGSESVSLRLNPEFDIATSSSRRFAEFLGYEEFLKVRRDPVSGFVLGSTNATEFLEQLEPHSTINDVSLTEAEEIARKSGLLSDDESLPDSMIQANRKIVDERKIKHGEIAFPVMVAVALAHNNWGRVFCYQGKQFKVEVADADRAMQAPFHPELGTFSKIVTVTDLGSKKSHSLPEVLALTILDGFYGQEDPERLADFFLKRD